MDVSPKPSNIFPCFTIVKRPSCNASSDHKMSFEVHSPSVIWYLDFGHLRCILSVVWYLNPGQVECRDLFAFSGFERHWATRYVFVWLKNLEQIFLLRIYLDFCRKSSLKKFPLRVYYVNNVNLSYLLVSCWPSWNKLDSNGLTKPQNAILASIMFDN